MMAVNKNRHSFFILGLVSLIVIGFVVSTVHVYAQTSGLPGVDEDASNIPNLIRVEDPDGTGKQAKEGKLRIGSAGSFDLSQTLEVLGDTDIQGSFIVQTTGGTQAFIADPATGYVGIGTTDPSGRLAVYVHPNENFANGAIYATSSAGHAIQGLSGAGINAGIHGVVSSNPYMYAVYGKAIDIANRGVSGFSDSTGTAPAGLFWGNVIITGGFLQGDASGLFRVQSLNDTSLPAGEGGRGIGVWAMKTPGTVLGNNSAVEKINVGSGEIIRSIQVVVRQSGQSWHIWQADDDHLTVNVNSSTGDVTLTNSSASDIEYKIIAHIETGVTIKVTSTHTIPHTDETIEISVSNTQPILFESNGYYLLKAEVSAGLSQSFSWKFSSSTPRGMLCDGLGQTSTCVSSSTSSVSGETIYYKMPQNYPGAGHVSDVIHAEWQGGLDVSRDITIQMIDIITPVNKAVEFNATNVDVSATTIHVPQGFGTPIASYSIYQPTPARPSSITSSGQYTAPNIPLDDAAGLGAHGVQEKMSVALLGTTIEKPYTIWLVPSLLLSITFPDDTSTTLDNPQVGQNTQTTAIGKPLALAATLSSNPYSSIASFSATGCEINQGIPPLPENALTCMTVGQKTVRATWTPSSGTYPDGFVYVKEQVVYAGRITGAGGGAVPATAHFTVTGYPVLTLDTNMSVNDLDFTNASPSVNQELGKSSVLSVTNTFAQIIGTTGDTSITVTTGTAGTYKVRGRTTQDLRVWADVSITKSSGGCTGCSGPKPPACCGEITNQIGDPQSGGID